MQMRKFKRNTPPMDGDPPWVCGNPQPRCGIRGTRSWQMAQCNPALHPDIATQQVILQILTSK